MILGWRYNNCCRRGYYLSDFLSVIESREWAEDGRIYTTGIAEYKGILDNLYVIGTRQFGRDHISIFQEGAVPCKYHRIELCGSDACICNGGISHYTGSNQLFRHRIRAKPMGITGEKRFMKSAFSRCFLSRVIIYLR